jgi:putative hydrolase of the HAD superfamily
VVPVGGNRARAVILDLDDTLFDHRTSARRGLALLVRELGATPHEHIADAWEQTAEELMARRRAGELDRAEYRRERVRHLLADLGTEDARRPGSPRRIDRTGRPDSSIRIDSPGLSDSPSRPGAEECDALYDRFLALYEEEWTAFGDALPALRAIRGRGVPIAVLTNGPEQRQQKKMRDLGLRDLVVGVWTSERIGATKPDPVSYLTVCRALDLDPADVLHVGDNPAHDLVGARDAGLQALHLDRRGDAAGGADRISALGDLVGRLR